MKMNIALFLMLMALAFDSAAFFPQRDVPVSRVEVPDEDGGDVVTKAGSPCAILLRYQIAAPRGGEIQFVGGNCAATEMAAIVAASVKVPALAAGKITVSGEAAIPPVYQCSVNVTWDPTAPSSPTITAAGTGCESTLGVALAAAVQTVRCEHELAVCRF
jgi:hypothetical protein